MKWLPDRLAVRLGMALLLAAVAIAALAVAVRQRDAARAAKGRAAAAAPEPVPMVAALPPLPPCRGRVLLASRIEALAPDVVPVVQVFPDGNAGVRRPAPVATAPAAAPSAGDAAILLPARALRDLSPAARGTLLEVIGRLVPERPVPPARLLAVDVDAAPDAIGSLLLWLP